MDYAANLALFLTERTGSCLGSWAGTMPAAQQRNLFGEFLGKGKLWINGAEETVEHWRKVCFGLDSECTAVRRGAPLEGPVMYGWNIRLVSGPSITKPGDLFHFWDRDAYGHLRRQATCAGLW